MATSESNITTITLAVTEPKEEETTTAINNPWRSRQTLLTSSLFLVLFVSSAHPFVATINSTAVLDPRGASDEFVSLVLFILVGAPLLTLIVAFSSLYTGARLLVTAPAEDDIGFVAILRLAWRKSARSRRGAALFLAHYVLLVHFELWVGVVDVGSSIYIASVAVPSLIVVMMMLVMSYLAGEGLVAAVEEAYPAAASTWARERRRVEVVAGGVVFFYHGSFWGFEMVRLFICILRKTIKRIDSGFDDDLGLLEGLN